jgi:hypothetical protein
MYLKQCVQLRKERSLNIPMKVLGLQIKNVGGSQESTRGFCSFLCIRIGCWTHSENCSGPGWVGN